MDYPFSEPPTEFHDLATAIENLHDEIRDTKKKRKRKRNKGAKGKKIKKLDQKIKKLKKKLDFLNLVLAQQKPIPPPWYGVIEQVLPKAIEFATVYYQCKLTQQGHTQPKRD